MSNISVVKEGTWLYDGQVTTGVRIVSCDVRHGSGDWQDEPEVGDEFEVSGFDVQWASPTSPQHYSDHASAVFPTL